MSQEERAARSSRNIGSGTDCFLFLRLLRCFTSAGTLSALLRNYRVLRDRVSPFGHPRIKGCSPPPRGVSPARHVLHRRPNPRHPPYALNSHPVYQFRSPLPKLPGVEGKVPPRYCAALPQWDTVPSVPEGTLNAISAWGFASTKGNFGSGLYSVFKLQSLSPLQYPHQRIRGRMTIA